MQPPILTTDTTNIITSGCFLTFGNEETTFEFPVASGNLFFRIRFVSDKAKEQGMKTVNLDDKTLLLELTNFDYPTGTGNLEPIKLGRIDEKELSLNIFVRKANQDVGLREVNYTFYLEK